MEVKKIIETKKEVIYDVICDCCGETCKTNYDYEFLELKANWGYGSSKDMEKWSAQICEKCVEEKLSFIKFKKTRD